MTDTTTITLTVAIGGQEYVRQAEGTHWARDDDGRLYIYRDDLTLLDVDAEHVVEIMREAEITTLAAIDADTTTNTEAN